MTTQEPLNILVLDDDPAMCCLIRDIVGKEAHQVVDAGSAEEALALLPFWTFQLAYLDYNLPGIDGFELGEYLRRNNPDMTIALVTGSGNKRLERRSEELNIHYIEKPFDVEDILSLIHQYTADAAARKARRLAQEDPFFAPPLCQHTAELREIFAVPNVPSRVEERIAETVKRALHNLRVSSRYTERDRVIALAGLLCAQVLGFELPKASDGATLYEEYDRVMLEHGRRVEFTLPQPPS